MRFLVPQFIDIEDKIFGPLTIRQAVYVVGGGGVLFALYAQLGFYWALLIGGPIAAVALALAFLKVNNRPFYFMLYAFVTYAASRKLYLWKRVPKKIENVQPTPEYSTSEEAAVTQRSIGALARSLDTSDTLYTDKHK